MTDEEKLKIAVEALEKLADEKNVNSTVAFATKFGSAGASMVGRAIEAFAQQTLDRIRGSA